MAAARKLQTAATTPARPAVATPRPSEAVEGQASHPSPALALQQQLEAAMSVGDAPPQDRWSARRRISVMLLGSAAVWGLILTVAFTLQG